MKKSGLLVVIFVLSVIVQAKTLRVVLDDSYPPYSFYSSSGEPMGICVELWKRWEKVTGIKVDLILTNWKNAIPMVENGKADVVDEIFYSQKRAEKLSFTSAYDTIKTRIFFDKRLSGITTDLSTLKGFDVGVKVGDYDATYLLEHGVKKLSYYPSYAALVKAAKDKKIHIFIMDSSCAFYYLSKYGLLNDFKYTSPLFTSKLYRAVKSGNERTLNLVENGFSRISPSFVESTMKKWKGQEYTFHFWQAWGLFLTIGLLIGAVAGALFVWNRLLLFTIKKKTKQLEEEMERSLKSEKEVAKLTEKLRGITEHLYELNENMTKMVNLVSQFSPFSDEKEFAQQVLELAVKLVPEADGGSISIMEGDRWKYLALVGDYDFEKMMNLNLRAEWMWKVSKVEVVDNVLEKDRNVMPKEALEKLEKYFKGKIFKSLVVPIKINGRYAGNIFLDAYKDIDDFSAESKHLMEMLGELSSAFFTIKKVNVLEIETQRELLREIVVLEEASLSFMRGHSERVAQFSESIGREMGLSWQDLEELKWCAIFHDIGFIGIPTHIRQKLVGFSDFSEDDFDILKTHSLFGESILSFSTLPKRYQDVVRAHHENYDGSGYPDGLRGEEIPLFSRIIMVANVFDEKVNIAKVDPEVVIEKIERGSGTIYDPRVVKHAVKVFREFASKLRKE